MMIYSNMRIRSSGSNPVVRVGVGKPQSVANPARHLFLSRKFYWNIATSIYFHIVCDCFLL